MFSSRLHFKRLFIVGYERKNAALMGTDIGAMISGVITFLSLVVEWCLECFSRPSDSSIIVLGGVLFHVEYCSMLTDEWVCGMMVYGLCS